MFDASVLERDTNSYASGTGTDDNDIVRCSFSALSRIGFLNHVLRQK
jgi:hypothetical protein